MHDIQQVKYYRHNYILPEPQEDENFLIEDIQGENAQSVVFLDRSRSTEFVECTLRQSREYFDLKKNKFVNLFIFILINGISVLIFLNKYQ